MTGNGPGAGRGSIFSETFAGRGIEAYCLDAVNAILDTAPPSAAIAPILTAGLRRVQARFRDELATPIGPVAEFCAHVERYRGKMLRPTLTLLSALAADPALAREGLPEASITIATVIEMIHMATLVHDDVLDEADLRRGGDTVNKRRGNEAAVVLGDYLISKAFHLCSSLDHQAVALRVGEVTSIVCEGEMLQVAASGRLDLSESDYFDIIERKTAALIALACELGATLPGAGDAVAGRMWEFGLKVGAAFQIQDDLLDLTGAEPVVGKPVGRDLEKGKLTLPVIHYLAGLPSGERTEAEEFLRSHGMGGGGRRLIAERLDRSGSLAYARARAAGLIEEARGLLREGLAESEARASLEALAAAVISRAF